LFIVVVTFAIFDLLVKSRKIKWQTMLAIFIVCIGALALGTTASKNTQERIIRSTGLYDPRIEIFKTAAFLIQQKPLLGYGIGGDREVLVEEYIKRGLDHAAELKYNVHNQYLQTLLEVGVVGFIPFILLFYGVLRNTKIPSLTQRVFVLFALFFIIESGLQRIQGITPFVGLSLVFCSLVKERNQKGFD
jgi:O-antigen ligase